jgi:hypothetical protein
MNKKILVTLLLVFTLVMAYLSYDSVQSELDYRAKVRQIDQLVIGRLDTLRKMQLAYRDMKGKFAGSFDELFYFMKNEKYVKVKEIGENDGEVKNIKTDSLFLDPRKEILGSETINVDRFKLVPPEDTAVFILKAGTINQNNVEVPVFEISDPHPFNKKNKALKVGDMNNAVTNGNWK